MPFNTAGFTIIELPPATDVVMTAFMNLPLDPYCGGKHRYRRFSQYRLHHAAGRWEAELLPHRPFIQSRTYNSYVGGVPRHLPELLIDPSEQLAAGAVAVPLDTATDWQVNVHQCRVITTPDVRGVSVPEGPHRDGHEIGMLAVFRREGITGAETQLMPLGGGEPFFRTTLAPGQAIVYEDSRMFHYATDIQAVERDGFRDLWIVAFNRWADRRYGPEFEARALAS